MATIDDQMRDRQQPRDKQ